MRISDWSSDVCSSDLIGPLIRDPLRILLRRELFPVARLKRNVAMPADIIEMRGKVLRALLPPRNLDQHLRGSAHYARKRRPHISAAQRRYRPPCSERPGRIGRKRAGLGKRVSVVVGLGGWRCIQKQITTRYIK